MKAEQIRLNTILVESIAMMCQKGLKEYKELTIRGVIAITVDRHDTFVVHINKSFEPTTFLESTLLNIKSENQQSGNISSTTVKNEYQNDAAFNNRNNPAHYQQPISHNLNPQYSNRLNSPQGPPRNPGMSNMSPQGMQRNPRNSLVPVRNQSPRNQTPRNQNPMIKMTSPNRMQSPNENHYSPNMTVARLNNSQMLYPNRGAPRGGRGVVRARGRGRMAVVARGAMRGKAQAIGLSGHVTQPKNDNTFKLVSRYMCGIAECNAAFVSLSNLRRHQKSKHGGSQVADDEEDDGEEDGEEYEGMEYGTGMEGDYMM